MGGWSCLPDDLLQEIFKRVGNNFNDRVHLRAICSNWRSFALLHNIRPQLQPSSGFPQLIIPFNDDPNHRSFFSFNSNKVHQVELPKAHGNYLCGSSQGYLVLLEHNTPSISLLNPLTHNQIQLPPLSTFPYVLKFDASKAGNEYVCRYSPRSKLQIPVSQADMQMFFVSKVVLSTSPMPNNYIAMAIFGIHYKKLAICKAGDKGWTLVQNIKSDVVVDDIIHYKGQFYALCKNDASVLVIRNLDGPAAKIFLHSSPTFGMAVAPFVKYLVELSGNLLLVIRDTKVSRHKEDANGTYHERFKTKQFIVFKLDQETRKWVRLKSIDDYALFVGGNCSMSVLTTDFPQCRVNCIYFTDDLRCYIKFSSLVAKIDERYKGGDSGIFNLTGKLLLPFPFAYPKQSCSFWPPPVWVAPSLC